MSMTTAVADSLSTLTLDPSRILQKFRREQEKRDREIQKDLAKRLYLASAQEQTKK